jgi:hypothetical protein
MTASQPDGGMHGFVYIIRCPQWKSPDEWRPGERCATAPSLPSESSAGPTSSGDQLQQRQRLPGPPADRVEDALRRPRPRPDPTSPATPATPVAPAPTRSPDPPSWTDPARRRTNPRTAQPGTPWPGQEREHRPGRHQMTRQRPASPTNPIRARLPLRPIMMKHHQPEATDLPECSAVS